MYIPSPHAILTAGLVATGCMSPKTSMKRLSLSPFPPSILAKRPDNVASEVASGSILDFAVEKCVDADGNQRCSKPFLVEKATCYNIEWSTEGTLSHTTVEVKDAGSGEMVFYRDTNGEWTPDKSEVSFI